jgi:hypothetical protein
VFGRQGVPDHHSRSIPIPSPAKKPGT